MLQGTRKKKFKINRKRETKEGSSKSVKNRKKN